MQKRKQTTQEYQEPTVANGWSHVLDSASSVSCQPQNSQVIEFMMSAAPEAHPPARHVLL